MAAGGLEPPRPKAVDFESTMSTNSITQPKSGVTDKSVPQNVQKRIESEQGIREVVLGADYSSMVLKCQHKVLLFFLHGFIFQLNILMKIASFFSGAGGLDLGFTQAGFDVVFANEFDKNIWDTYRHNHSGTILDTRSIVDLPSECVPDVDGIIGGPPCQSWSEAGSKRGVKDKRGLLFFEFIRLLEDKQPKFFMAENVRGMLAPRHEDALTRIKELLMASGYDLHFKLLNASDYGVPQDRKRVIFIGFRRDLCTEFSFPEKVTRRLTMRDSIAHLDGFAVPAVDKTKPSSKCVIPNHEYMTGSFSSMYMSRNRVRAWDEVSFTIQAGGRHAPIHPSSPKMVKISKDVFSFVDAEKSRRLSVRECACLQGFPDDFLFLYDDLLQGYKMVGNAVPVNFARTLASAIMSALSE